MTVAAETGSIHISSASAVRHRCDFLQLQRADRHVGCAGQGQRAGQEHRNDDGVATESRKHLEEKDGVTVFDGKPHEFYAWELVARMSRELIEVEEDKAKNMKEIIKIQRGLKGDAFEIAQDMGVKGLIANGGLDELIKRMTDM